MTADEINGQWFVTQSGKPIAGPFRDNGQAWRWIDQHSENGHLMPNTERMRGICTMGSMAIMVPRWLSVRHTRRSSLMTH
jgi:hypothetical protein